MPDKSFQIHGQQIPWSYFWKVVKKYGLQKAQQVFFLCREKRKIMNYISAGMKKEWFASDIYPTTQMDSFIKLHFDKNIPAPKKRKGSQKVTGIASILENVTK